MKFVAHFETFEIFLKLLLTLAKTSGYMFYTINKKHVYK